MQIAVTPRLVAGIALLVLCMAVALSAPGTASAATLTCKGHTKVATPSADFDNPIDYTFGCTGRIVGFMVINDQEMSGFDTELEVHDMAGALVPSDGFGCEGDIPGNGVGCVGSYSANNIVGGTFDVADRKACDEPRSHAQLVVVAEALDTATSEPKKNSRGATAGPFDLGRPLGCPKKSSVFGGLLAQIALLRADLKSR